MANVRAYSVHPNIMRRNVHSGSSLEFYNSMLASDISRQLGSPLTEQIDPKTTIDRDSDNYPLSLSRAPAIHLSCARTRMSIPLASTVCANAQSSSVTFHMGSFPGSSGCTPTALAAPSRFLNLATVCSTHSSTSSRSTMFTTGPNTFSLHLTAQTKSIVSSSRSVKDTLAPS
jgi:hypothetical protein